MSAMDLSKMGTAKVVLNTSDCNHIVIEKWPVSDVEWAFYLYAATELNRWQGLLLQRFSLLMPPYAS